MPSQHDVVQHVHVHEKTKILKCSGDAADRDQIGREPEEALPLIDDVASIGVIYPRQAVEQRGLPGTVRADDRQYLIVADGKIDAVQGPDSSKIYGEIFYFQHAHKLRRAACR